MLKKFEDADKKLRQISKYTFWKDDNQAIYLGEFDIDDGAKA